MVTQSDLRRAIPPRTSRVGGMLWSREAGTVQEDCADFQRTKSNVTHWGSTVNDSGHDPLQASTILSIAPHQISSWTPLSCSPSRADARAGGGCKLCSWDQGWRQNSRSSFWIDNSERRTSAPIPTEMDRHLFCEIGGIRK